MWKYFLAAIGTGLIACGTDKQDPETFEPGGAESNAPLLEADLNGLFALKQSSSERLQDPFGGDDWEIIQSVNLNLMNMTRTGDDITLLETNCATRVSPVFGATTEIPAAYLESTSGKIRTASLSNPSIGASFEIAPFIDTNGLTMDSPESESMPTDENDSRIIDQDNDGNPGLTVDVVLSFTTGQVYVAQRVTRSYTGLVVNSERIEGGLTYHNEQITLGASSILFGGDQTREPDEDESLNWFILQKVDESLDCNALVSSEDDVFQD